ncbi:uncharacterized protein LOC128731234 [Anopheles nili]|uniref:uncharacterized protein LOC128731234 n=1 Tax=Anopheles nili TaxID=185578 RepID=UPI00237AA630|nr:uncharacterized protein LOC128731234 [Anopheles nili]
MNIKSEIHKRLAVEDRSFTENIGYGIKLWKSSSFYYMSKYDITFDFFLNNVQNFFSELAKLPEYQFNERWLIVNTFLALSCPTNALPASVVGRLEKTFRAITEKSVGRKEQLLQSLFLIAFDVKYKNFYKFDFKGYAGVLCVALHYYIKCLQEQRPKEEEEKIAERIFNDIKIYLMSAADLAKWKESFDKIVTPLCGVVLLLEKHGVNRRNDLLDFFEQVYFTKDNASSYNRVTGKSHRLQLLGFDVDKTPLHVMALLIEGFLRAYREQQLEILLFLKYYLQNVFVNENQSILADTHQVFSLTKHVFALMRKHFIMFDQQLMVDFNFTDILTTKLKELLDICTSSDALLRDFLSLICTINDYNPLILEHSVVDIILKIMFLRKDPDTLRSFQDMLISTINMYVKLNKNENFRDELFMKLGDYLDEHDLDETILQLRKKATGKRKSLNVNTPTKKMKLANGSAETPVEMPEKKAPFWDLLRLEGNTSEENKLASRRVEPQNFWPTITFAWPDADGRLGNAMKEYAKLLLTNRSFAYWKKFMFVLNDTLNAPEHTESIIFQLELALCWLCYFFAGNTLVENSNLFWNKLLGHFHEFDQVMGNVARQFLLNDTETGDKRLYGAYLNTLYFYGNFRLMVQYYRPDSIEENSNIQLHSYLNDTEWGTIMERTPDKDVALLNRVLLQKLRVPFFIQDQESLEVEKERSNSNEERHQLIEKILNDTSGETFRPVLLDRATNVWFLRLLDKQRQRHVIGSHLLDRAYCPLDEMRFILQNVSFDHELLEVFVLSVYKRVAEILSSGPAEKASSLRKISFDELFDQDNAEIVPQIQMLLKTRANKRLGRASTQSEISDPDSLGHLLDVLDEIRVDSLDQEKKSVLVAVHLLLLVTMESSGGRESDVERFKSKVIKIVSLGTTVNVAKFVTIETLIKLFGISPILMILLHQLVDNLTEESFEEFKSILANFSTKSDDHFDLLLLIYNLEQRNISRTKPNSTVLVPLEQRNELLVNIVSVIDGYLLEKDPAQQCAEDAVGFNRAIKACSISIRHKVGHKDELGKKFHKHLLAYMAQAMLVNSYNSDILLTKCLAHHDYLALDPAQTVAIKEKCWQSFLNIMHEQASLKVRPEHAICASEEEPTISKSDEQTSRIETLIGSLGSHLSEEEFAEKLNSLNRSGSCSTPASLNVTLTVFTMLAKKGIKNTVSHETCKVFVRSFAAVVGRDVMGLCVLNQLQCEPELVGTILECFATIIAKRKLSLFPGLLDYMLQFMSAINIGKRPVQEGEEVAFYKLHRLMSDVLFRMLEARTNYLVSRLPGYLQVYHGLIGAIICYKGDSANGKALTSFEILSLSDLLLPLERIIAIARKMLESKLSVMAPYTLAQIVHTIVQCKRPTTQQDRIAAKVYNICFDLMAIYDVQASSYLLRTMDESSRLLFTKIKKRQNRSRFIKRKATGRSA